MNYSEYFKYDPDSPSKLSRISKVYNGIGYRGTLGFCGNVTKQGNRSRWRVKHLYKSVFVHLIVWELFHGKVPDGYVVDHINRNPLDNSIENLRIVSHAENCRNRKLSKNSNTKSNGVNYSEKEGRYRATWRDLQGRPCSKSFSVAKYGEEMAFTLACAARKEAIKELNNQGAGYTEQHGT